MCYIFLCFTGALAHSKQLKHQQQQQADAEAAAEKAERSAIAAATAGQKAAAVRMKHKMSQLSPTKGQLHSFCAQELLEIIAKLSWIHTVSSLDIVSMGGVCRSAVDIWSPLPDTHTDAACLPQLHPLLVG